MNWHDVLPPYVAKAQIAWERAAQVHRARKAGATYAEIALKMRLTVTRVRSIAIKHGTWQKRPPIEKYFEQAPFYDPEAGRNQFAIPVREGTVPTSRIEQIVNNGIAAGKPKAELEVALVMHGVSPERAQREVNRLFYQFKNPAPPRPSAPSLAVRVLQSVTPAWPPVQGVVERRDGNRRTEPTQIISAEQAAAEKKTNP